MSAQPPQPDSPPVAVPAAASHGHGDGEPGNPAVPARTAEPSQHDGTVPVDDAPAGSRAVRLGGKFTLVTGGMALVIFAWWLASSYIVGPRMLPPPAEVWAVILELFTSGALVTNFSASIGAIVFGFTIGSLLGLPIGVLIGRSTFWRILLQGPVTVIVSLPGLAYGVLMLAAFGLGPTGPVVAAAMVAMPYVVINTAEGIRAVDRDLVRMSHSYQRSRFRIVRHVLIPSVTPYLFASLRYAFAQGWKIVAIVEVFGATNGIGFMIRSTYQSFSIEGMLAWTISFVALMLFVERVLLVQVERRVFRWRSS